LRIASVLAVAVRGGYFNEDLAAIQAGARRDGFVYAGHPVSDGYTHITEPSEAVSVALVLDNGAVACGDAVSVEYASVGGRRGRFRASEQLPYIRDLCAGLEGREISTFAIMMGELSQLDLPIAVHKPAALYGVSQAVLQAVAAARGVTAAEVLASELGTEVADAPIRIYAQSGEERYWNVDKMILKRADALPHGLINEIDSKLGREGELLADYVTWVAARVRKLGDESYTPELHFDVYGLLGKVFDHSCARIADYLKGLEERAAPFQLCIETPVLMNTRDSQIERLGQLRTELKASGSRVQIVADEWANDIDDIRLFVGAEASDMIHVKSPDLGSLENTAKAVLECWANGVRPILGGSCTDTDVSARAVSHVALATQPAWVLARPGMGVDEGLQIVHNEMLRTLAVVSSRSRTSLTAGRE
jgi:methylaspartate ammonia-lyase